MVDHLRKLINNDYSVKIWIWKVPMAISKSATVETYLYVDALYFKPDIHITVNDCISGTAFDDELEVYYQKVGFKYFWKKS